jgi:hypothetical protein
VIRMGGRRRVAAVLSALVVVAVLAGCSQMQNPTYDVGESGCTGASDETLRTIQGELDAPGKLRNGKQIVKGDETFVSAELHLRSDDKHDEGDILTWVTPDVAGSEFFSVDVHAREQSSWPTADIDVRAAGARESRACTGLNVGKTKAQLQCEQDEASGEVSLPGGRECDDL